MRRIDGILGTMYHIVVDAIFDIGSAVLDSKEPAGVGLVLGEQQLRRAFEMKPAITGRSLSMQTRVQLDHRVGGRTCLVQVRPRVAASPGPCVTEPHRRQQSKIGCFGPTVRDLDLDQDVLGVGLGIFHEHIEVAIVIEDTRI